MSCWVFYSSKSGHTARLLQQAGLAGLRIPQAPNAALPQPNAPFVLVTPSFGDASGHGAVPKAVIRFLNQPEQRRWLRGVVGCGDRNFGAAFAQAGLLVARKCQVPLLHRAELFGTRADWLRLQAIDAQLAQQAAQSPNPAPHPQRPAHTNATHTPHGGISPAEGRSHPLHEPPLLPWLA